MQTIKVSETISLGIKYYKPECEISKTFSVLLRTNNLNLRDISLIKKIGFKVELINNIPKEL